MANFIKKATVNAHGQFRAKAQAAGESTPQFAQEHSGDSGKTGKQARLAITLMGLSHKKSKKHPDAIQRRLNQNTPGE